MADPRVSFEAPKYGDDPRAGSDSTSVGGPRDYFTGDGSQESSGDETDEARSSSTAKRRRRRASLSIKIPPSQAQTDMAFTALQYLPMPVLLLSSTKQIVLANEAVGRLLGIDLSMDLVSPEEEGFAGDTDMDMPSATDMLQGKTLGELEIDILQGGSAVYVSWEDVLQSVVNDASKAQQMFGRNSVDSIIAAEDKTPTGHPHRRSTSTTSRHSNQAGSRAEVHDAVVDVIFSTWRDSRTGLPLSAATDKSAHSDEHVQAKMIISVWATEDEQYYTLTFTAAALGGTGPTNAYSSSGITSLTGSSSDLSKTTSRIVPRTNPKYQSSALSSNSSSGSSGPRKAKQTSTPTSTIPSPHTQPLLDSLPAGPPHKSTAASAPTIFTKSNRLKDAILNSMSFPAYAMWKDQSFGVPNKAAVKLIYPYIEDGDFDMSESARDFLSRYILYREDFVEQIPLDDIPILRLMREQKPFDSYRVGMYSAKDGSRQLFDVTGEPVLDDRGEFLGGLVVFHDVTDFQNTINLEKERNERQFEDITNMVPQMIWRTTPNGDHDYYSQRWYDYTGLTVEKSHGLGWANAFHPDDLEIAKPKWAHSLATGEEYLTEYRCKSASGEWRWMLGRAVPMRDEEGRIMNWFGTCTDIHDLVLTREEAKQTRAQLERVIELAHITLWSVDKSRNLVLFEGKPMYDPNKWETQRSKAEYLSMNIYDIIEEQGRDNEMTAYKAPIEGILAGKIEEETIEVEITSTGRWFRTRFFPMIRQNRAGGIEGDEFIDGVVGVSMDVTEVKRAESEVQKRNQDNARLMAQSAAAKEASKMKSQFLANMSHEIRTPIAGVIGMSELLLDDDSGQKLTTEQRECAENIQRSANGLLTVINDILDFSKVESGRLDIEEVQFDLSVVIKDVNKMLSFAAERKNLKYIDDIPDIKSWKVMGDPGRLRQVMTNLLTNSIKFTSKGSVTMGVQVKRETNDTLEVEFIIQDTGIGIEPEVQRKLFKPFSQADSSTARRFGGTGLGLTICKSLVNLMHGNISLESTLGVGTKASFWIPFLKAPYQTESSALVNLGSIPDRLQSEMSVSRASSELSRPATPATPGNTRSPSTAGIPGLAPLLDVRPQDLTEEERKTIQILVVEDNPINQQIAIKTIRKLGFPVKAVWNGKEALEYLQNPSEDRPPPDVILMDVQMPIMDGYKATYTIRNSREFARNWHLQGTPIVAMTASAIQGDREKCQKSGMDDYLAKPVKKPNLEKMIVKWAIEGRRKRAELEELDAQGGKLPRPSNVRTNSSFESHHSGSIESPHDQLSGEVDRLEIAHLNAVARSSETTNDSAIRQLQAEEKAITLRDEVLKESGEDPKNRLGRGFSDAEHSDATSALSFENMQKLESGSQRTEDAGRPKPSLDHSSSMSVTVGDVASIAGLVSSAQKGLPKKSPLGQDVPD